MKPESNERIRRTRISDDGLRLITVERWLDRQVSPPRWRSKNWNRKLKPNDVEYYRQRGDLEPLGVVGARIGHRPLGT